MQIESERIRLIQSGWFPLNAKRIILNATAAAAGIGSKEER